MASRMRGCLAVRPTADARGWEVVVEAPACVNGASSVAVLGPFAVAGADAGELERAVREALARLLGIRER